MADAPRRLAGTLAPPRFPFLGPFLGLRVRYTAESFSAYYIRTLGFAYFCRVYFISMNLIHSSGSFPAADKTHLALVGTFKDDGDSS